jgi:hypothetical protein
LGAGAAAPRDPSHHSEQYLDVQRVRSIRWEPVRLTDWLRELVERELDEFL